MPLRPVEGGQVPPQDRYDDLAGIILAGGAARRMGGRNKALLEVGGVPILERILRVLKPLCWEVLLVAKDPETFRRWGDRVRLIHDQEPLASPAVGLRCGLAASSLDYNLVVGTDLPFLDGTFLGELCRRARGYDACLPRWRDRPEPLLAVYHRRCLEPLEEQLATGEQALWKLLPRLRVRYVECEGTAPPLSFFNINRPEDLERANEIARNLV